MGISTFGEVLFILSRAQVIKVFVNFLGNLSRIIDVLSGNYWFASFPFST
jgi:hypothetical protein